MSSNRQHYDTATKKDEYLALFKFKKMSIQI